MEKFSQRKVGQISYLLRDRSIRGVIPSIPSLHQHVRTLLQIDASLAPQTDVDLTDQGMV